METPTIARLLRPYAELGEGQLESISMYIDVLSKWNSKINLTAVRSPEEIVTRHFGESFFMGCRLLSAGWQGSIFDFGSGPGFPGLPLAMYAPLADVVLGESNSKKAVFLNEAIFALGLKNVKVFNHRAEQYAAQVDLVTMRAVEKFEGALGVAANLGKQGGRVALMIGATQVEVAKKLASTMEWHEPVVVPGGHSRVLLVGTKK